MIRPTFSVYLGGMILAAALLSGIGAMAGQMGEIYLPIFVSAMLPVTAFYAFTGWDLPKHHPVGRPLGLIVFGLIMATVFAWVGWSEKHWMFPPVEYGAVVGTIAGLTSAPGFLRRRYRSHVRGGVSATLTARALMDDEIALGSEAAEALGRMDLAKVTPAVPLLIWATQHANPMVSVKAAQALQKLGLSRGVAPVH